MRETRNYTLSSNYTDHTTFGGLVKEYDYDTYLSMSEIASRIIEDWEFDEQCRKNAENRKNK